MVSAICRVVMGLPSPEARATMALIAYSMVNENKKNPLLAGHPRLLGRD